MDWSDTLIPEWRPAVVRTPLLRGGRGGGPAVVLVLGLQRTASTAARGFAQANFSDGRIIAREHGLSERHRDWLQRGEAIGIANFGSKRPRLEQVRVAVAEARRLDVLITVREPVARAVSYFLFRNRGRIGRFHDPATGGFHEAEAIARDLRAFCRVEAKRQAVWFREELQRALGCDLEALAAGPVRREGLNLHLIRCETAAEDLLAAGGEIGPVTAAAERRNDTAGLGMAAVARDFARAFALPRRLKQALAGRGDVTRFYPAPAPATAPPGPLAASAELLGEEARGLVP